MAYLACDHALPDAEKKLLVPVTSGEFEGLWHSPSVAEVFKP